MKRLAAIVALAAFGVSAPALACSLAQLNQAELKANTKDEVQEAVTAKLGSGVQVHVTADNYTQFQTYFPNGLGADCSGLDSAYSEAGVYLHAYTSGGASYKVLGTVRVNGYDEAGRATVNLHSWERP